MSFCILEEVLSSLFLQMHLLVLGWNSVSNKQRAEELFKAWKEKWYDADYLDYEHRKENWPSAMSFVKEQEKLLAWIEECTAKKDNTEYAIIAKSAWTNLFFQTIELIEKKPTFVLLCWIPLKVVTNLRFDADEYDTIIDFPVTVLQNEKDPVGPYWAIHHNLKTTKRSLLETHCKGHYYDVDVVMENISDVE